VQALPGAEGQGPLWKWKSFLETWVGWIGKRLLERTWLPPLEVFQEAQIKIGSLPVCVMNVHSSSQRWMKTTFKTLLKLKTNTLLQKWKKVEKHPEWKSYINLFLSPSPTS
jgi:hypothetical protein